MKKQILDCGIEFISSMQRCELFQECAVCLGEKGLSAKTEIGFRDGG